MRHLIQSVKGLWKITSPKEEPLPEYDPTRDIYKRVREIREQEKKKFEQNKRIIKSMNTGYLPGSIASKNSGYSISNTITASTINNSSSAITINGDPKNGVLSVDVPLVVNGRDVMKELDEMRDALLLLKRDVAMEEKYPRLKELKEEYELALEKYKTFEIIKESK